MGAWGTNIFSSDLTSDVRDRFFKFLRTEPEQDHFAAFEKTINYDWIASEYQAGNTEVCLALAYIALLCPQREEIQQQVIRAGLAACETESKPISLARWKNPNDRKIVIRGFWDLLLSAEA